MVTSRRLRSGYRVAIYPILIYKMKKAIHPYCLVNIDFSVLIKFFIKLIFKAASQGHTEVVEFLVKYNADLDLKTNLGYTALISGNPFINILK
jgi:hypothetical protein